MKIRVFFFTTLMIWGVAGADEARVSTAQPFVEGDIWVAATLMNDPDDDHRGVGRLLQYDADFNLKGELWIDANHP